MSKKKHQYGCHNCGHSPKKIPYGSTRKLFWCDKCDGDLVTGVNKKGERQKAKKEIKSQLEEEDESKEDI